MELRSTTIKFSKQKRSDLKTKEQSLQKELQELDSKICNDCSVLDKAILDRYETAKEFTNPEEKRLCLDRKQNGWNTAKNQPNIFNI